MLNINEDLFEQGDKDLMEVSIRISDDRKGRGI